MEGAHSSGWRRLGSEAEEGLGVRKLERADLFKFLPFSPKPGASLVAQMVKNLPGM